MLKKIKYLVFLVLLAFGAAACSGCGPGGDARAPEDAVTGGQDQSPLDTAQPGQDQVATDTANGGEDQVSKDTVNGGQDQHQQGNGVPVLREHLPVDLALVDGFAVLQGSQPRLLPLPGQRGLQTLEAPREGDGMPTLVAVTKDGQVVAISLLEWSDGGDNPPPNPGISRIYSTTAWIFFSTWGLTVQKPLEDGTFQPVNCTTVAARRKDSALFCAGLGISSNGDNYGNVEPYFFTVLANAAGGVVYFVSGSELNQCLVYRLAMDGPDGPVATLVQGITNPRWLVVNGRGDLLLRFMPLGVDQSASVTRIYPVDGGEPLTIETQEPNFSFGLAGQPGAADEDTFYFLESLQSPRDATVTLTEITRSEGAFSQVPHSITVHGVGNCGWMVWLADGLYAMCGYNLAKLVQDASVITEPALLPLTGVEGFVSVGGMPVRFTPGFLLLHTKEGQTHKFLRHTGLKQEDILLEDNLSILGMGLSANGTIDFLGLRLDTNEKILGTIPPDTTNITIMDSETINPDQVVTFTKIN